MEVFHLFVLSYLKANTRSRVNSCMSIQGPGLVVIQTGKPVRAYEASNMIWVSFLNKQVSCAIPPLSWFRQRLIVFLHCKCCNSNTTRNKAFCMCCGLSVVKRSEVEIKKHEKIGSVFLLSQRTFVCFQYPRLRKTANREYLEKSR